MPVTSDRVRPLSLTSCRKYTAINKFLWSYPIYIMGWGEVRLENGKEMSSAEVNCMLNNCA